MLLPPCGYAAQAPPSATSLTADRSSTLLILLDLIRTHPDEQAAPDEVPGADLPLKTSDLNSH